jgi:hypothetical protein
VNVLVGPKDRHVVADAQRVAGELLVGDEGCEVGISGVIQRYLIMGALIFDGSHGCDEPDIVRSGVIAA